MSTLRTAWHPAFTSLLRERAPRWIEVHAEVPIRAEPLRIDDVLALRPKVPRDPRDEGAGLRPVWRRVGEVALLELKSRAREFRRGDLGRLLAYAWLWYSAHDLAPHEITLFLVVPRINEALRRELAAARLSLTCSEDGAHEVTGLPFCLVVVELRVLAAHEDDDLLRWFADPTTPTLATRRWVRQHFHARSEDMSTEITPDLEGYEQIVAEIVDGLTLEERLTGLAPEELVQHLSLKQRLAGLAPQDRLADLSPEESLLALPDVTLRSLPESYVDSLAPAVRDAIRRRLAR